MLRLHKKILIPLCLVLTCSVGFSVAFARHHRKPLHNGDIVFDERRFKDSVRETAQQALAAAQTAKELSIRVLNHTSVDFSGTVNAALDRYSHKYLGKDLDNPENALASLTGSPMRWLSAYDPSDPKFETDTANYLTKVHADTSLVEADVAAQTQQRLKDINTLANTPTPGHMGEMQKNASISILRGLNTADESRLEGAQMASDIADREAQIAREYRSEQQAHQQYIAVSDPYNPTEQDKAQRPAIDNFGFLSTQQTE